MGVMKDGEIVPEFKEAITAMADIIRTNRNNRRN